jgi:tetratricopeptide (TPR) repeat protein
MRERWCTFQATSGYVVHMLRSIASILAGFSLFVLLCPNASLAQGIDWAKVHDITARGIHAMYNLEVDRAEAAFDSVSAMAPGDPRGPFFASILHIYLYGLKRSDEEYNRFFDHSDRVIKICDGLLETNENDAVAKFYLGGIYGYRGLAYQMTNSLLKAVKDGMKGYDYLEEAVRTDTTLYDAHMGFGLFRYLVAKVPKTYRWILNVIGFSGDLEGGLNSLRLAAEKGVYTRTEAKLYLWQFLNNEHRTDEALKYMRELLREYPENSLFATLYSSWCIRSENLDEALLWAKKAEEINRRKKVKVGEEFIYSTMGGIYYTKGEFDRARESYEVFSQKVQNREYISNYIAYRFAVSCELTGHRSRAIEICREMKNVTDRDRAMDTYYYRKGRELLEAPLTDVDILFLRAANESTLKRNESAFRLFSDAAGKAGNDADRTARALYGMMATAYEQGDDERVVTLSSRLVVLQPARERWVIPHGYFKLGQSYARLGKRAEAQVSFEAISRFDGYDFQSSLENRAEDELEKLTTVP